MHFYGLKPWELRRLDPEQFYDMLGEIPKVLTLISPWFNDAGLDTSGGGGSVGGSSASASASASVGGVPGIANSKDVSLRAFRTDDPKVLEMVQAQLSQTMKGQQDALKTLRGRKK